MSENIFKPPHPLKMSVLFLIFNRLDTTKLVFEEIRKVKPPRLYIAADGPRREKKDEREKVKKVREYVMNNIDWNCEVKTLFRENNLGCGKAVSEAITWFFENEEMGIILEDDCLPSQSFFWFCEELLERYKDDTRVWHIGGYYPFGRTYLDGESYYFSRYTHVWGWATWRRAWVSYDVEMRLFEELRNRMEYYEFFGTLEENKKRKGILEKVWRKEIDTWDYQWNFCVRVNNGIAIKPSVNLVENIGFGKNATHTTDIINNNIFKQHKAFEIDLPLIHPKYMMINRYEELKYVKYFVFSNRLYKKIFILRKIIGYE